MKGDNCKYIFVRIMPLFFFHFYYLITFKHSTAKRWHPHVVLLFCFAAALTSVLSPNTLTQILLLLFQVNPFPHNPDFKGPQDRGLLKTLWVKEKMLVMKTLGEGEIAHYEQFLLFPAVFSKDLYNRT